MAFSAKKKLKVIRKAYEAAWKYVDPSRTRRYTVRTNDIADSLMMDGVIKGMTREHPDYEEFHQLVKFGVSAARGMSTYD